MDHYPHRQQPDLPDVLDKGKATTKVSPLLLEKRRENAHSIKRVNSMMSPLHLDLDLRFLLHYFTTQASQLGSPDSPKSFVNQRVLNRPDKSVRGTHAPSFVLARGGHMPLPCLPPPRFAATFVRSNDFFC
jgi:hypothetical protein